jgi:hypothetical protein
MPQQLTTELVKKIFAGLGSGKPDETFAYIADDVKWASLSKATSVRQKLNAA